MSVNVINIVRYIRLYFYFRRKHFTFALMKQKKNKGLIRDKHVAFSLSSEEYEFISSYIKKYKITNKSRWLRETVIGHVLKTLDQDYPTLFDENEMRR